MSDFLGTPIPEEDKEADQWLTRKQKEEKYKNKFVPLWQQEVRDEKTGKRFFSGAFKGGAIWSVGFNGTVGSSEGWAPSTFASSRGSRAQVSQRPEDFMDEEDKELLGLGSDLATHSNFDSLDGRQRQKQDLIDYSKYEAIGSAIPGPLPLDLFVSKAEPIGKRLLRLMGWREGQGIGPRRARSFADEDEDDPFSVGHLFAPKDIAAETYQHKNNHFGVGYDQYAAAPEFRRGPTEKPKAKHVGFGIGVLEDEDDYEVYDDNPFSSSMYVTEIETRDEKKIKGSAHTYIKPSDRKAGVLPGFTKATKPPPPLVVFSAPDVPRDFKPVHVFPNEDIVKMPDLKLYEMAMQMPSYMVEQLRRQTIISAAERGQMLGEAALPSASRGRMMGLAINEPAENQRPPPEIKQEESPFKADPPRQRRYETWLRVQKGLQGPDVFPTWDEGLTRRESQKEQELFLRTWGVFAPLTGSLADKFVEAGVLTFDEEDKNDYQAEDFSKTAAELNMYGTFTRSDEEWHPENVLCRRFNVANPYFGQKKQKEAEDLDAMKQAFDMWEREDEVRRLELALEEKEREKERLKQEENGQEPQEEAEQQPKLDLTQEPERPSIDLFKAIFEDDDSESSEESSEVEEKEEKEEKQEQEVEQQPLPKQQQGPSPPPMIVDLSDMPDEPLTSIDTHTTSDDVIFMGPSPPAQQPWYTVINIPDDSKGQKRKYEEMKDKYAKQKEDKGRKHKRKDKEKRHKDKRDKHKEKRRHKSDKRSKRDKHTSKKHKSSVK